MAADVGRESDKFMLRLPEGMRERIKAAADANSRSMNAEIVATLETEYPVPLASADHALKLLADLNEIRRTLDTVKPQSPEAIALQGYYDHTMNNLKEAILRQSVGPPSN